MGLDVTIYCVVSVQHNGIISLKRNVCIFTIQRQIQLQGQLYWKFYTARFLVGNHVPYDKCYIETYKTPPHLRNKLVSFIARFSHIQMPTKIEGYQVSHSPGGFSAEP